MAKEKVQEAVVEETEVATAEAEVAEATEEVKEDTTTTDETANADDGDVDSPWYYFFAQGCGWCKKANPVVEGLIEDGDDILMLDVAEPDNAKLRDELFAEYNTRCGTPWFINAETGKGACGFREQDILEVWLSGKDVPEPPRPTGSPPKSPFHGSTGKEETAWKKEYKTWIKDNKHMPDTWQKQQKSASAILDAPRPKSDPPRPPMAPTSTDEQFDEWGKKLGAWQEENKHLPNQQPVNSIVQNMKMRRDQMVAQQQGGAPGAPAVGAGGAVNSAQLNTMDARVQALEVKIDKLMSHFGVK